VNELDIHLLENNKLVSAHKFFGEPVQLCSQWTEYPKDHLYASRMEPQKKVVGPILSQIHELCDSPKQDTNEVKEVGENKRSMQTNVSNKENPPKKQKKNK